MKYVFTTVAVCSLVFTSQAHAQRFNIFQAIQQAAEQAQQYQQPPRTTNPNDFQQNLKNQCWDHENSVIKQNNMSVDDLEQGFPMSCDDPSFQRKVENIYSNLSHGVEQNSSNESSNEAKSQCRYNEDWVMAKIHTNPQTLEGTLFPNACKDPTFQQQMANRLNDISQKEEQERKLAQQKKAEMEKDPERYADLVRIFYRMKQDAISSLAREKKIGSIGGYVDKEKIYTLSKKIQTADEAIEGSYKEYIRHGGTKALAKVEKEDLKYPGSFLEEMY